MNFLTALLDAAVGFVRRNPLTVLLIVVLAIAAPALLKGIAMFVLYFILGLVVLAIVAVAAFRWRIYKMRRQMEQQFGEGFPGGDPFAGMRSGARPGAGAKTREGEVRVHKTAETPEKRVSRNVGDYVEFEEEKAAE